MDNRQLETCAQCEANARSNEAGGYTELAAECRAYCLRGHREAVEGAPERPSVKLIPMQSTWTCPTCERQNVYREGVVSSPQNQCSACGTEVQIGALRDLTHSVPQPSDVQKALAELREMFSGNELTIDFATRPDGWQQVSIFRFAPPNLRDTILAAQGYTLAEAMEKVRKWKAEIK